MNQERQDLASVPRWVLRGVIGFLVLTACGGFSTLLALIVILTVIVGGQRAGRYTQAQNSKRLDRIEAKLDLIYKRTADSQP